MALPVVCVRPTMPLLGQPDPFPLTIPPLLEAVEIPPLIMPEARPRYITDFPLSRISTQYWIATLLRATYSSGAALFTQAARAVIPESYPITFVANTTGFVPGYGILKFPEFLLVCISGTSNLNQWLSQIFLNPTVATSYPIAGGDDLGQTMALYKVAADAIDSAISLAAGDDRPVLLAGHSMGGAVALVLNYKYRSQTTARKPGRCITFGAPKPGNNVVAMGSRTGAQVLRRLTITGDPIAGLPPTLPKAAFLALPPPINQWASTWSTYEPIGSLYYVADDGSQAGGSEPNLPILVANYITQVILGRGIFPPVNHLMKSYVDRFRANFGLTLPAGETARWTNPSLLKSVNDLLTATGL